jgi:hypothetical protein
MKKIKENLTKHGHLKRGQPNTRTPQTRTTRGQHADITRTTRGQPPTNYPFFSIFLFFKKINQNNKTKKIEREKENLTKRRQPDSRTTQHADNLNAGNSNADNPNVFFLLYLLIHQ